MSTRLQYRTLVGRALGRRYYISSTTTGTSTAKVIADSKRQEDPSELDGATLKVGNEEVLLRGGGSGELFTDTDLAVVPVNGTTIEIVKGFTITDMNDAIDWSLQASYPHVWDAVDDKTTSEVAGTDEYPLTATWRLIHEVRREQKGTSSPVRWTPLWYGSDYELLRRTAGLVYRPLYETVTGTKVWVIGESLATLGSTDAATNPAPDDIVKWGALYWLYEKGSNPDEAALTQSWERAAKDAYEKWMVARTMLAISRQTKAKVRIPYITVINDGQSRLG